MCGIIGYIGESSAAENLLDGLKNLEYRGYDSAGIALNDNNRLKIFKAAGKLNNLCQIIRTEPRENTVAECGIGHIRWATHGLPNLENAHPHRSADENLALVHNGIIENYLELRKELSADGYHFTSQTDTEAIVHLIDRELKNGAGFEDAVQNAVRLLDGAFALGIVYRQEPDKLIAVKKNAPLIIGIGQHENFIASDIAALLGKAEKIVRMEDGEIAVIRRGEIKITDFAGKQVMRQPEPLQLSAESIDKGGYKHFMLKEIHEQPGIIRALLADGLQIDIGSLRDFNRIEIIACGTSLHAALAAAPLFEDWCRCEVSVQPASEYIYKKQRTGADTLVIGISQSGETADTITALKQAQKSNAQVLVLTNRPDSSIVRYADKVITLQAGIEVSVAATKSYTAQLLRLYQLALALAKDKNFLFSEEISGLHNALRQIPVKIEEILAEEEKIKTVAKKYARFPAMAYIARGQQLPSAMEGALKLKEISYINACAYAAGELKHGPIALLDANMPVAAVLCRQAPTYAKTLSNCEEAKARKAPVIIFSDQIPQGNFDDIVLLPQNCEEFAPLTEAAALQLFAYFIADELGREIDQPRNLAKSVTVE